MATTSVILGVCCTSTTSLNKINAWLLIQRNTSFKQSCLTVSKVRNIVKHVSTRVAHNIYSFAPSKGIWILKSGKFLLVESGMLGLGIQNTAVGIRNPTDNWNPDWNPVIAIRNPQRGIQNQRMS